MISEKTVCRFHRVPFRIVLNLCNLWKFAKNHSERNYDILRFLSLERCADLRRSRLDYFFSRNPTYFFVQAMSTVASKRGHCYVGLKRNNNNEWLSPDNKPVSVPPNYWDKSKNEPKTAPDFLCAYLYNSGKSSFLSSASCGGDNPAIKCFICYKPAWYRQWWLHPCIVLRQH